MAAVQLIVPGGNTSEKEAKSKLLEFQRSIEISSKSVKRDIPAFLHILDKQYFGMNSRYLIAEDYFNTIGG